MSEPLAQPKPRRSGGRNARQALRAAPLAEEKRPVRSGMQGGQYKPLDEAGVKRIHQAALQILEEIGLADAPQSGIDAMTAAGAQLGDDGRLRFSPALVEDMLAKAGRNFPLCAQNPKYDLHPGGSRVHYGTAGAAVHVVDVEKREYRESTLADIYDAARIVETLDNVHFFQRPMVARDLETTLELDINTVYAAMAGTTKHIGASFISVENVHQVLDMLHIASGDEAAWRARPFVSNSNCFVVPPMKFATEACEFMKLVFGAVCRFCFYQRDRPELRPRRQLPVLWHRPWRNVWRVSCMSIQLRPAIRPSLEPGLLSRTCVPGQCLAVQGNKL